MYFPCSTMSSPRVSYELPPFPPKALSSSVGTAERAAERNNSSTGSSWDEGNPGNPGPIHSWAEMIRQANLRNPTPGLHELFTEAQPLWPTYPHMLTDGVCSFAWRDWFWSRVSCVESRVCWVNHLQLLGNKKKTNNFWAAWDIPASGCINCLAGSITQNTASVRWLSSHWPIRCRKYTKTRNTIKFWNIYVSFMEQPWMCKSVVRP